jgi:hypothetical protein
LANAINAAVGLGGEVGVGWVAAVVTTGRVAEAGPPYPE